MKHDRAVKPAKIIDRWRKRLLLNEWAITVVVAKKDHSGEDSDQFECLAEIDVNGPYLKARITIYPGWFMACPEVQEHALVHELCHIVTDPLKIAMHDMLNGRLVHRGQQADLVELVTQRVANIAFGRAV